MPYRQKHLWKVEVLNPVNNTVIQSSNHRTINEIANKYNSINLATWRNICMGRSKVYNKFIKVSKIPREGNEEGLEAVEEVESQPIIVRFD